MLKRVRFKGRLSMKTFTSKEEAESWMKDKVDDPCVDNYRFAYLDDNAALAAYERQRQEGCCGEFDEEIIVNGRKATIGCNYGH